ncbi:putative disease resistance protein At1g59780 [Eucalyptus grandis]|uniref:putative disease resistance protein At1g59780 n=1 Tax=Eucalyptus grandis TaxID=71139 RepID=UPI00192EBA87|nr:putative disease resistance protein At1g59780 [Eucalyptus grandis]
MPKLRYLGLRWTVLDSLPTSVQFLSHLDTLDLKHTNVTRVPSSILKVRSLQHLYMNEVCMDRSIFYNASSRKSLANLKTLWGLRIERKSAMLSVLGKFTGLRKLGLTCHCTVMSDAAKSVARLTNLQSLRLRSLDIFDHPSCLKLSDMSQQQSLSNLHLIGALELQDLQCLPRNLQILTLSMTQLEEDEMEVLKKLTGLTSLRLLAGSYKGQSMTCADGAFPALRVLKLWKLEPLEKWTIEKGALPRLQELEIRDCTRLIHIFGLIHVEDLQEINLTNLEKEVVMTVEGMRLKAVVIVRELAVPPLQEGYSNIDNEEDDKNGDDTGFEEVLEDMSEDVLEYVPEDSSQL